MLVYKCTPEAMLNMASRPVPRTLNMPASATMVLPLLHYRMSGVSLVQVLRRVGLPRRLSGWLHQALGVMRSVVMEGTSSPGSTDRNENSAVNSNALRLNPVSSLAMVN